MKRTFHGMSPLTQHNVSRTAGPGDKLPGTQGHTGGSGCPGQVGCNHETLMDAWWACGPISEQQRGQESRLTGQGAWNHTNCPSSQSATSSAPRHTRGEHPPPKAIQSINEPPPVQCSAVPATQYSSRSKVIDHCDSIATRDPCTDPHTLRGRHLSTVKGCHLTQGVWSQNTAPT